MLFRGSRYEDTPIREHARADGEPVRYIGLRLIPETRGATGHVVEQGERLDHIAHQRLGDPEQYWRICDASRTVRPEDLLEPGRRLDVPGV